MVEVTHSPIQKTQNDAFNIEAELRKALCAMPQDARQDIARRCGGAFILIDFPEKLTKRKKAAQVPHILEELQDVRPKHDGRLSPVACRKDFPRISIYRCPGLGKEQVELRVDHATLCESNLLPHIERKLAKGRKGHYTPRAPMELLGWGEGHVSLLWGTIEPEVIDLLRQELASSGFRRIWLFERGEIGIFFVYPSDPI